MSVELECDSGEPGGPARLDRDERLARSAGRGSERAFATIYRRHHQALYRYARAIVHDDADAQDVLQAAFTSAFVALERGRRSAPLRPWLFRIVHNEAISLIRARRPAAELDEQAAAGDLSPDERVEQQQRLRRLVTDLNALPERQRGALLMRELSGLGHAEIAAALGISIGTAKQTILEARRSLLEFERGRRLECRVVAELISARDGRRLRSRSVRAHLATCPECDALATAIGQRRTALRALAPPVPAAVATALLSDLPGGAAASGGLGLAWAGAGGVADVSGITAKVVGAPALAKLAAGLAAVAVTGAGIGVGLTRPADRVHRGAGPSAGSPAQHTSRSLAAPAMTTGGRPGAARAATGPGSTSVARAGNAGRHPGGPARAAHHGPAGSHATGRHGPPANPPGQSRRTAPGSRRATAPGRSHAAAPGQARTKPHGAPAGADHAAKPAHAHGKPASTSHPSSSHASSPASPRAKTPAAPAQGPKAKTTHTPPGHFKA